MLMVSQVAVGGRLLPAPVSCLLLGWTPPPKPRCGQCPAAHAAGSTWTPLHNHDHGTGAGRSFSTSASSTVMGLAVEEKNLPAQAPQS